MAITKHSISVHRYFGASTDTKPTTEVSKDIAVAVPVGSTFFEYDTGILYVTYDGTNWVVKDNNSSSGGGKLKTISVTKALVGGACSAEDILSESVSAGTYWTFAAIARVNGGKGYITKAHAICETTAITPRLTLFLFNATPTCAKNDNVANTALLHADLAKYVGKIDFPAMEDLGTGDSEAVATPSTYGNLPLEFECASDADDLIGVLVARDAVTPGAGDDMTVRLTVEQE